jgi:hypothetical protein
MICKRQTTAAVLALSLAATGCLDILGHQENVTQHDDLEGKMQIEDDRIEDKHPTFDPNRVVTEAFPHGWVGSCEIQVNKSAAVTKLEIAPFEGTAASLKDKVFRGRPDALAAVMSAEMAPQPPDKPEGLTAIPSLEVVNGALKPFNDGLYAAVELQVEDGKNQLLAGLATRLNALRASADASARVAIDDAAMFVGAAQKLGGTPVTVDTALAMRIDNEAAAFTRDAAQARPIGFYTWSPALERIFTRDRYLQNRDGSTPFGAFAAIALVLGQDAALLADYQRVTALYAGLTNPYLSYTIEDLIPLVPNAAALANPSAIQTAFSATHPPIKLCTGTLLAFLPASRSKEVDYLDEKFCAGVPAGTNLLDVLVNAIRNGDVDLATSADSGWYDYQLHALETLLLPERGPENQHLLLTAGYKKKLIDTFKSLLIQNRETHVKQLAGATGSSGPPPPPVDLYPLLPAEPFASYYLRSARGYRFLRTFLDAAVGTNFAAGTARLLENGVRGATSLEEELDHRVALLYGLHFLSADAVGMSRGEGLLVDEMSAIDVEHATSVAKMWLAGWRTDADVARDPRVVVPIRYGLGATTYWAVIGVKAVQARAEFVKGHEPMATPTPCWSGNIVAHRYALLVEDTAEFELPADRPPPTRSELRAVCDAHDTKDAIVRALGSL